MPFAWLTCRICRVGLFTDEGTRGTCTACVQNAALRLDYLARLAALNTPRPGLQRVVRMPHMTGTHLQRDRLVATLAEVEPTLQACRDELLAHLAAQALTLAAPLPLPTQGCLVARHTAGLREVVAYTFCDGRTGAEGFQVRVDVVVR